MYAYKISQLTAVNVERDSCICQRQRKATCHITLAAKMKAKIKKNAKCEVTARVNGYKNCKRYLCKIMRSARNFNAQVTAPIRVAFGGN